MVDAEQLEGRLTQLEREIREFDAKKRDLAQHIVFTLSLFRRQMRDPYAVHEEGDWTDDPLTADS